MSSLSTPFVSVVVPIHNEADRIEDNLAHIAHYLRCTGVSFEVLAIDDGSSDSSWEALNRVVQVNSSVRLLRHTRNIGKGFSLRDGILGSKGTWVLLVDADLELPIELLRTFIEVQSATWADVVVGSKKHAGSVVVYPLARRVLSRVYSWVISIAFDLPISDTQVGFKLLRGSLARKIAGYTLVGRNGWDVEMLVAAKLAGAKMTDAPVTLTFGRGGRGRVTPSTVLEILKETAGIWFRRYIDGHYLRALGCPPRMAATTPGIR
ncbi:MAG: glycosyltransferase family 2 protein [Nitrososphaerota archaeon]|jgi:glycosyltransferase involved in cell wall biosynthesis|nr:glycosyltransferase family 2 protein [Nitrososphaerota archaeon]